MATGHASSDRPDPRFAAPLMAPPAQPPHLAHAPVVGEVPQNIVNSGLPFWLDFDMDRVPEDYRFSALEPHYRSLPVTFASLRRDARISSLGSWSSRKLRGSNLVPGLLDSLPFGQPPIHLVFPTAQIHSVWRRHGTSFSNQLCVLHIVELDELMTLNDHEEEVQARVARGWAPTPLHTFQVLPRRVHYNMLAEQLLGVTMLNCPSTRIVTSAVPLATCNEAESPSARRGGYALLPLRSVKLRSLAVNVPLQLPIDCVGFETGHRVFLRDLEFGQGRRLVAPMRDVCVLKMETGLG